MGRTFHIPAVGGFLLHECTEELAKFYDIGKEVSCFNTLPDLVEKIRYYLDNENIRDNISVSGKSRAIRDHSLDIRAVEITKILRLNIENV